MKGLKKKQIISKKIRNKGFTLVELLAVIAILAVLVLISLPSVLAMVKKSRLETFLIEAKTVYKESANKYISEGLNGNKIGSIFSEDNSKLNINAKSELKYCVILDDKGKVDKIAISNGEFYILKDELNSQNDIKINDVKDGKMLGLICDRNDFDVDLNCTYSGRLKDGAKYTDEGYTYIYSKDSNDWSVEVDKNNINDNKICKNISGRPVIKLVEFLVTFDQQEGAGGVDSINVIYNMDMPKLDSLPTRTGYTFNGYYTETNGNGTKYYNADGSSARSYNIVSNTILYAYWTVNKYAITFDQQEGTGGTTRLDVIYGNVMPAIDSLPTRSGYKFQGYYSSKNGEGIKYYNENGISDYKYTKTSNITLYAYWKLDKIACADLTNVLQCNTTDTSKIINFTGTCSYVCEDTTLDNFKIKFKTTGTLTINNSLNIDAFLVGGGGGGNTSDTGVGGAGGGGYAKTIKNITLSSGTYEIKIGAGGGRGAKGGTTSINQNGSIISGLVAAGGNGGGAGGGYLSIGGSGGSGGGGFSDDNIGMPLCHGRFGNDGSFNNHSNYYYSFGQINHPGPNGETGSTCEFGQGDASGCYPGVDEYSGGGCCGCCCTVGGGGGSCGGGNGTANTGGGGGAYLLSTGKGGSGIVIIRNKR